MRDALDTLAGLLTSERCNAETLEWSALRYQHTAAVRSKLMEDYRPATVNKMISALRGVLKECWRLGQMDAEEYHKAADLPTGRGYTVPKGRALAFGELRALFAACAADPSLIGRRAAAMLAVLCGGGLRRAEVVAIDLADYDSDTGALKVMGKGRKKRVVYATNGAKDALDVWLKVRGQEPGPLFVRIGKGERMTMYRLTDQAVWHILQQRRKQANVKTFSPHDLRRTFISTLWDAGADGGSIQRLAGHANIQTTARYDRRGEEAKRRAAEMVSVPFAG
jgi:site-specific recombinase XerD